MKGAVFAMITFRNVYKSYKSKPVLYDISLTVETGEFLVLIGSSGCGKTTLLKMVNKLNSINRGEILIDGVSVAEKKDTELRREIGYVVQDGGLFPHMTVGENIRLALEITGYEKAKREARVDELLCMVDLDPGEYKDLFPSQLSGGQRQRVGVARAFAADPQLILMDEPFSALDPVTRMELQDEIVHLQKQYGKTIIFVTHDMDEAIKMAHRICIIENGRIVQCGTPEEILKQPADDYVEEFVGKNRLWANPDFIKAKDIMKLNPIKLSANRTVLQALQTMNHYAVDSALIATGKNLEGVVWLEDLQKIPDYKAPIGQYISQNYISVHEDTSLLKIINTIDYNISGIIPVIKDDGTLSGYLTKSSLLAVLSKQYEAENCQNERSGVI